MIARDAAYNAALIRGAATKAGVPAEQLVTFAERRAAVLGPEIRVPRDFPLEGMEEAGDGSNYCGFDAQLTIGSPSPSDTIHEELFHLDAALQGFARAFHHLAALRELRRT